MGIKSNSKGSVTGTSPDEAKKAKIATDINSKVHRMIKDLIIDMMWPWASRKEIDKNEGVDFVLGSTTPDISHDEGSGSCYSPKSDVTLSSDWEDIKKVVDRQIANKE